jgi:hypothetical protein
VSRAVFGSAKKKKDHSYSRRLLHKDAAGVGIEAFITDDSGSNVLFCCIYYRYN